MTNKQVAEAFANGATKGKSNNMFIEGDRIYSYGKHFCIAERSSLGIAFVTKRKYSVTTGRHKSHVKYALGTRYQEVETLDKGF